MLPPRVVQITSAGTVPEEVLFERIQAAGSLAPEHRARVAVQLRDPELTGRALYTLGARLREATRAAGVALVINDRIDLALALGADGIHLGRRSVSVRDARALAGPRAFVSVACHAVAEVVAAAAEGADAAVLSPIFATPGPGKGAPIGPDALRDAREALRAAGLSTWLVALGGVDEASAPLCFAAGADGVSAIRADLTRSAVSTLATHLAT